mmetsp:Transcript_1471/g.2229  ORF Transcript_1471/g.2229 Transcript_1471/m.2229 type:complete len:1126 (-) Transcript_1471:753-4130(-)
MAFFALPGFPGVEDLIVPRHSRLLSGAWDKRLSLRIQVSVPRAITMRKNPVAAREQVIDSAPTRRERREAARRERMNARDPKDSVRFTVSENGSSIAVISRNSRKRKRQRLSPGPGSNGQTSGSNSSPPSFFASSKVAEIAFSSPASQIYTSPSFFSPGVSELSPSTDPLLPQDSTREEVLSHNSGSNSSPLITLDDSSDLNDLSLPDSVEEITRDDSQSVLLIDEPSSAPAPRDTASSKLPFPPSPYASIPLVSISPGDLTTLGTGRFSSGQGPDIASPSEATGDLSYEEHVEPITNYYAPPTDKSSTGFGDEEIILSANGSVPLPSLISDQPPPQPYAMEMDVSFTEANVKKANSNGALYSADSNNGSSLHVPYVTPSRPSILNGVGEYEEVDRREAVVQYSNVGLLDGQQKEVPQDVPREEEEVADSEGDMYLLEDYLNDKELANAEWGIGLLKDDLRRFREALVAAWYCRFDEQRIPKSAAGPGQYDARLIEQYYDRQLPLVLARLASIVVPCVWLAALYWLDRKRGKEHQKAVGPARAAQLRELLTNLGPAYIKIGQALSIRPDIVGPVTMNELQKLQDRLPPFPNAVAYYAIRKDFGASHTELFSELSPDPIAAASLGQVYKGRLRDSGLEVAVKVQRPQIIDAIALDMYLMRKLAVYARKNIKRVRSDLPAIVDEFASRLFDELDYIQEGRNAVRFKGLYCEALPDIRVPNIYFDYTSARVLTMQWMDGTKLTDTEAIRSDADYLVELGVRCSLMQLLSAGFFHADPHPGNLLRTPDGKLAYLDFGMMSSLDPSSRTALIKAVVHLVNREFESLTSDFVDLGFLPPDVDVTPIAPALTSVFQGALKDGAAEVSFQNLSNDLAEVMYKFPFRIPPAYSLVIRSLTVLEGIALANNPNFKVLSKAYPYIVSQLITDPNPELRASLKDLLIKDGTIRWKRLESLLGSALEGMAPVETLVAKDGSGAVQRAPGLRTSEALAFLFSDKAMFVRDVLVDQVATAFEVLTRQALYQAQSRVFSLLPPVVSSIIQSTRISFLNPAKPASLSQKDTDALQSLSKLLALMQKINAKVTPDDFLAIVGPHLLPETQRIVGRLGERYLLQLIKELQHQLENAGLENRTTK